MLRGCGTTIDGWLSSWRFDQDVWWRLGSEVEITAIETMGDLASVIFDRIVHGSESGESGLFSAEAMNNYSEQIVMAVDTPQVQNMVDRLIAVNLIHCHPLTTILVY